MEKSKLGLSIALLSAVMFLTGYLGLTGMVLVGGYILLKEENVTLKKTAVGTIILYLFFTLISLCIGVLDNVLDVFNFGNWMYRFGMYTLTNNVFSFLNNIVSLAEKIVFGLFAMLAFFNVQVKIPLVDKLVDKHL